MPFRYTKILIPIDGSEHSRLACQHAMSFSRCGEVEFILLHCFGDIPLSIGGDARHEIIQACEVEAKAILAPFQAMFAEAAIPVVTLTRAGTPERVIVHVVDELHCDLIVMGSRGLSDFSGMLMGSVSHRVLRHASVPVLMVR